MNKFFSNLVIAIGLIGVSTGASAEVSYYVGANAAFLEYEEDDAVVGNLAVSLEEADVQAFYIRLGAQLHENLSVELRGGTGLGDDTVDLTATNTATGASGTGEIDLEVDEFYGAYVRAGLPLFNSLYPYLIAGFTHASLEAEAGNVEIDSSGSDFSYGIGADWKFYEASSGNSASLNIEYGQYYDRDDAEISGFAVGLAYSF